MKNLIFGCLLAFILFQSCHKNEEQVATCENCSFTCLDSNETDVITNGCINNWECNFVVTPQSKVDITEYEGLGSGAKNVFQMINSTQGDVSIADDEFTTILVFELADSQDSFAVEDSELENMKVHFRRVCHCVEGVEFSAITTGCIEGEKQADGTWFIQGNLHILYSFGEVAIKFEAQFVN